MKLSWSSYFDIFQNSKYRMYIEIIKELYVVKWK